MIITSIFIFLTLIYREVGKYIIHPVPVNWKNKIDAQYLNLCKKIKGNRLERNSALEVTFKRILIVGFLFVILLSLITGRTDFLLELVIILSIILNLNFIFQERKPLCSRL